MHHEPLTALAADGLTAFAIERQRLSGHIDEIVWMLDPRSNRVFFVSARFEDVFGFPVTRLQEDPRAFLSAVHPDDRSRVEAALEALPREQFEEEYRVVRPGGAVSWVRTRAFAVELPAAGIDRIAFVTSDVTERRGVERKLRESSERLRAVLNSAPPMVLWAIDRDGVITVAEGGGLGVIGLEPGQMAGLNLFDLYRHAGEPKLVESHHRALAGEGSRFTFEIAGRVVDMAVTPEYGPGGEITGAIGVAFGITERVRAERVLRETEERFRTTVRAAPVIIWSIDRDGVITFSEGRALYELGYEPGELVGRSVFDMYRGRPDTLEAHRRALGGDTFTRRAETGGRVFETLYAPVHDEQSGVTGVIGVATDITERDRAERAAEETEARLRAVMSGAPIIIWAVDRDGVVIFSEGRALEALGLEPGVAVGTNVKEMTGDYPGIEEAHVRALRGESFKGLTTYSGRIMEVYYAPLYGAGGAVDGSIGVAVDVTDRERAAAARRESDERLRRSMDVGRLGTWEWDVATGETRWSESLEVLHGIAPGTFGGTAEDFLELVHPDDRGMVSRVSTDAVSRRGPFDIEYRVPLPDGSVRWMLGKGDVVLDRHGEPLRLLGVSMDITERKASELALRESEEKFRDLVENLNEMVFTVDPGGIITYISPAVERVGGYAPEEVTGRSFAEFVHPDDVAAAVESFARTVTGHLEPLEYRLRRKDGTYAWVRSNSRPVVEGGRITDLRGVVVDLSERKRAEDALRESEERFRRLAENADDLIYRYRLAEPHGFEYVSPAATRMTGYTPEEICADPDLSLKIIHPDDRAVLDAYLKDPSAWQRTATMRWVRKDGTILWAEQRNVPVYDSAGKLIAFEGISRDVTERVQAEAALRESEERFRSVAATTQEWIWSVDLDGLFTYCNESVTAILGYEPEELMGVDSATLLHPDDRAQIESKMPGWIERREGWSRVVARTRHKDGTYRYIESTGVPIAGPDGAVVGFRGSDRDVTERVRAEEALRESEERYRLLFERNLAGVYRSTEDGRLLECNGAFARMLGYGSPEEVVSRPVSELYATASDREEFLGRLRAQSSLHNLELRLRRKDGGDVWVLENVSMHRSAGEGPGVIEGTMVDITEAKLAERALAASEERFRNIVETTREVIWEMDLGGRLVYCNPSITEVLGYSPEELAGALVAKFIHPDDLAEVVQQVPGWVQAKQGWRNLLLRWRHRDGSYHYLECNAVPVLDAEGNLVAYRGSHRDLTERVQNEQELRRSAETIRLSMAAGRLGVWDWDLKSGRVEWMGEINALHGAMPSLKADNLADVLRLIHPADREAVAAAVTRAVRETGEFDVEYRVGPPGGPVAWMLGKGNVVRDATGKPVRLMGATVDVTRRKRAEQALARTERNLRAIIGNVDEIVYAVRFQAGDPRRPEVEFMSGRAEQVLGYAPEEFQNSDTLWYSLIHPEDRQDVERAMMGLLKEQRVVMEYRARHKATGEYRWLEDRCVRRLDSSGRLAGVQGVARDVTERKLADEEIRQREETLRAVVSNVDEIVYFVRRGGEDEEHSLSIQFVSDRVKPVLGYTQKEFLVNPRLWVDIIHPDDREAALNVVAQLLEDSKPRTREFRLRHKTTGEYRWMEDRIVPRFDGEGGLAGFQGVARDITARKQAQESAVVAREELEERVERVMGKPTSYGLTFRELTILHLVAEGRPDRDIADALGISVRTAQTHLSNILVKMGASSRTEAGVRAVREGLID